MENMQDVSRVISLGPDNKFVTRVFNGGLAAKWQRGGRFYRGWWQQIDKEDRCEDLHQRQTHTGSGL